MSPGRVQHPNPCGVKTAHELGAWRGFTLAAPYVGSDDLSASLDAGVVIRDATRNVARVAVFDGALPPTTTHDAMRRHASTALDIVERPVPLSDAWEAISDALCDRERRPRLSNPCFAAAGADLDLETGTVNAVVAGDCEVWVRVDGTWAPVAGGDMLTPQARRALTERYEDCVDETDRWYAQFETLDEPDAWTRTPLGFVSRPKCVARKIVGIDGLIVTTDGAGLTPDRCADLDGWLREGIHDVPADHPYPHPHGDLWVTLLER